MQPLNSWTTAPARLDLSDQSLHIWRITLDEALPRNPASAAILDQHEQQRAERFTVEKPRQHFVRMRTTLRIILSRYTNTPPTDHVIEFNPHGKPVLRGDDIHFNMSHSGDLGLIAVTRSGEVGVDLEHIQTGRATRDIAYRFFSTHENAALAAYPDEERTRAFFRCWSRKEAVIKALGEGLACPLSSFDVSLDEDRAELLQFRREERSAHRWCLIPIDVHTEYAAAAAVIGSPRETRGFVFSDHPNS